MMLSVAFFLISTLVYSPADPDNPRFLLSSRLWTAVAISDIQNTTHHPSSSTRWPEWFFECANLILLLLKLYTSVLPHWTVALLGSAHKPDVIRSNPSSACLSPHSLLTRCGATSPPGGLDELFLCCNASSTALHQAPLCISSWSPPPPGKWCFLQVACMHHTDLWAGTCTSVWIVIIPAMSTTSRQAPGLRSACEAFGTARGTWQVLVSVCCTDVGPTKEGRNDAAQYGPFQDSTHTLTGVPFFPGTQVGTLHGWNMLVSISHFKSGIKSLYENPWHNDSNNCRSFLKLFLFKFYSHFNRLNFAISMGKS